MISTASDLNRFFRPLLSDALLPPGLLRVMETAVPAPELGPVIRYGLGLMAIDLPCGKTVWGHGGDIPGFETFAFNSPDGRRQEALAQTLDPPPASVLGAVLTFTLVEFCGSAPASSQPVAMEIIRRSF